MLKITLKMCAALLCTSALASQAFAEDLASAGSYGNYLKPGCTWSSLGKQYHQMNPSNNPPVGVVIVDPVGLFCPPNSSSTSTGPYVVKVNVTYDFNPGYGTDYSTCTMYPSVLGTLVGTSCGNYKVSR